MSSFQSILLQKICYSIWWKEIWVQWSRIAYQYYLNICRTCHNNLSQVVKNKLQPFNLSERYKNFWKLEKVLIAKKLLLKKVSIMPKGQFPKMVLIETVNISSLLPSQVDCNGMIIVQLKRALEYWVHVLFEPVRPSAVLGFLHYLKAHSNLYSDVAIEPHSIPEISY